MLDPLKIQCIWPNVNSKTLVDLLDHLEDNIHFRDHISGFDIGLNNKILETVNSRLVKDNRTINAYIGFPIDPVVKERYSQLHFRYFTPDYMFRAFENYHTHPPINFKNFICSFNGGPHVSRKLLVAILHKNKWFNREYCSKNFSFTADELDGHIAGYVGDRQRFYNKFFLTDDHDNFFAETNSFGVFQEDHTTHNRNIKSIETKVTESFIHIVSESMATSYHPFITEKFFYSVVTRGLFLTYGQPRWYEYLEKYHGFKKYDKIFDYRFDAIQNPVERLVELITMVSKFSNLTVDEWNDLYQMESETIEYNYDHYFSGNYIKQLYETV